MPNLDLCRRMHREADKWLNDAHVLMQSARVQSDAPALLSILGFEILLKCALELSDKPAKWNHEYVEHWKLLPPGAKREILRVARSRSPGRADLSRPGRVLRDWTFCFNRGRYYYQLYSSEKQERAAGRRWLKVGAPTRRARVRFHPEELLCMTAGLRAFVEARLG